MRSAAAALAFAMKNPSIPYWATSSIDGLTRKIDDLECARSVMAAYDVMPINDMDTATRMWQRTEDKRTGTPLHGAPLCFPNYGFGKSGHIALYDASTRMAWTTPVWINPADEYTTCHLISIEDLARRCGNPYAGWAADIAGMPINFTSPAGGSASKPIEQDRNNSMAQNFVNADSGDKNGGKGSEWATIGLAGQNGPGQVRRFTRTITDGTNKDQAAMAVTAHGLGTLLPKTDFDELVKIYGTPATLGKVTATTDPELLAAVLALAPKIDALPAEIDRYADGRKQAS